MTDIAKCIPNYNLYIFQLLNTIRLCVAENKQLTLFVLVQDLFVVIGWLGTGWHKNKERVTKGRKLPLIVLLRP